MDRGFRSAASHSEKLHELVYRIEPQGRLLRSWQPEGGVSAQVTALEVVLPNGHTKTMVVRQHSEAERKRNPCVATDEFTLLQLLQTADLPAPTPYYLDESGELFPEPYLVVEYIEGRSEFAPGDVPATLATMATTLARIHDVGGPDLDLSFLPTQEVRVANLLANRHGDAGKSRDARRMERRLSAVWPLPQANVSVLLHGDYWPGNLLWRDGRLVGVIDWEDAAVGDPLADLANARLEILWAFGIEAMQDFTRRYLSATHFHAGNLPYWDLCAALRHVATFAEWSTDEIAAERISERHDWFVSQALNSLPRR